MQAHAAEGMPVLVSFATQWPAMLPYMPSFSKLLIDSGAYSAYNSGKTIDLAKYRDWVDHLPVKPVAVAGLDDIGGWKRSMKNYEAYSRGFPTFHDTDPPELLDDLIAMAKERDGWIGLGLSTPRTGKLDFVREARDRIGDQLANVHGWALKLYSNEVEFDSVDSTNWYMDMYKIRASGVPLSWLTPAECLDLIIKRYQREARYHTSGSVTKKGELVDTNAQETIQWKIL